ncbi:MAG TPA: helix-turn-helix transcriptional regulator [Candidatus Omnitrophota bacterium]|nr:helix-turn-helix transcriptional regulator [Candidatus Omnitrophota bacterium]
MSTNDPRIYDPETGGILKLERLILKLGIEAVARKYKVCESTVRKWRKGLHKPSPETIAKSLEKLF